MGQSPLELNFDSKNTVVSPRPGTSDVATLTEVGHKSLPPRKPPRAFFKSQITRSLDSPHTHFEFDTILEHESQLEESDEVDYGSKIFEEKNSFISPCKLAPPGSLSPSSPCSSQGRQQASEFVNDEYYIDESLPSSLSIEGTTTQSQGELSRQLEQANSVIALFQVFLMYISLGSVGTNFILLVFLLLRTWVYRLHVSVSVEKKNLFIIFILH